MDDWDDEEDQSYDENGNLTPYGLAVWMDNEGGLSGLMERNGGHTFVEAGCDPRIVEEYERATEAMEEELRRIGAVL